MKQKLRLGNCHALTKHKRKQYTIIRYISLLAVLTSMCLYAVKQVSAQTAEPAATAVVNIKPLQIGDTIPEALWHLPLQVVNHPEGKDTITLNDYRGKLMILDFWATWCGSCILGMVKLDSVSDRLGSTLALLSVTEEAERVGQFIDENKLLKSISPMSIIKGQILSSVFSHKTVPHVVVIDKNGVVASETLPERLNCENLTAFASTGAMTWYEKFDTTNQIFPAASAYVTPRHFYSMFSGAADGLGRKHGLVTNTGSNFKRFYASNVSLRFLLTRAVGRFVIPASHIRLHPSIDPPLFYDSLFTYEATFPIEYRDSTIERYLMDDIIRYTGLGAKLETKTIDCWIIYAPDKRTGKVDLPQGKTVSLKMVVSRINALQGAVPVTMEGPIKQFPVLDIAINEVPAFEEFSTFLHINGLDMRKETKPVKLLSVSNHF